MSRRRPGGLACVGLLAVALACGETEPPREAPLAAPEVYAVYAAMLRHSCADPEETQIVIGERSLDMSGDETPWSHLSPEELDRVPADALAALLAFEPRRYLIDGQAIECDAEIITAGRGDLPFGQPRVFGPRGPDRDWEDFYILYPGAIGILDFSPVGFSADGQRAVLYQQGASAPLSGGGGLYVLERQGDTWQIVDSVWLWIS